VLTPFKQSVGFQEKHASGYAARKSNAFALARIRPASSFSTDPNDSCFYSPGVFFIKKSLNIDIFPNIRLL
jgi:hypothetical protein